MTKEELAQSYADAKAAEFTTAIKEAYLKGYEQGELKVASTVNIDGVTYVDLGLPSGTLWSKTPCIDPRYGGYTIPYLKLGYYEAQKLNLPTEEQVKELTSYRRTLLESGDVYAVGPTSERIRVNFKKIGEGEDISDSGRHFWIKGDVVLKDHAKALTVWNDADGFAQTSDYFIGYKLPFFLVKNKSEL